MSDTNYAQYQHYGTNAERLAFTPSPGTGQPIYAWYATDTGITWVYDSSWHQVSGGGANAVTAAGTLTNNALAIGQGSKALATTTTGTGVLTALGVNTGSTGAFVVQPANYVSMLRSTTTVTNAQMLTLHSTPVTLVAAPGSGLAISPVMATLYSKTSAGAYGNVDAAAELSVRFDTTHQGLGYVVNDTLITNGSATLLTDLLTTTTNTRATLIQEQTTEGADSWGPLPFVASTTGFTNVPLVISLNNQGSGALSGGNAASSLTVIVYYFIETVP